MMEGQPDVAGLFTILSYVQYQHDINISFFKHQGYHQYLFGMLQYPEDKLQLLICIYKVFTCSI